MYEDEYYYEARKKENAKLDAELAGTFATVSYTHLDVYKRQYVGRLESGTG